MKNKGSFLTMTLAVVGIVLYVALFDSILSALTDILEYANLSTFTALSTVVAIAPVVLLLSGIFAASFAYYKGYKGANVQDSSGILRMVMGVVQIILFVTLFSTILTSFYTLYTADNVAAYTAFTTVVGIAPVVLFLSGIFSGGATAVSGARSWRSKRRSRLG